VIHVLDRTGHRHITLDLRGRGRARSDSGVQIPFVYPFEAGSWEVLPVVLHGSAAMGAEPSSYSPKTGLSNLQSEGATRLLGWFGDGQLVALFTG
jgi:hypothetical protein